MPRHPPNALILLEIQTRLAGAPAMHGNHLQTPGLGTQARRNTVNAISLFTSHNTPSRQTPLRARPGMMFRASERQCQIHVDNPLSEAIRSDREFSTPRDAPEPDSH